jgi:hypothetical protein
MKKLLQSTLGSLAMIAFLATPMPMYARGGDGGHGGAAMATMDMLCTVDVLRIVLFHT